MTTNDFSNTGEPLMSPELRQAWQAVTEQAKRFSGFSIAQALRDHTERARQYRVSADQIILDYSKHLIDDAALNALFKLAKASGLTEERRRLFAGEAVNETENRAALHMALRADDEADFSVNGQSVMPDIRAVRDKMLAFVAAVHSGQWLGATGKRVTDVVNIGIGGSDLGPRMVYRALKPWRQAGIRVHFIANVDPDDLRETLSRISAETTLFIVTSKTFTTAETMANASAARAWLTSALGEQAVPHHFVAASTNAQAVQSFGISVENMFEFWDWVGGRYSLWSAVGLSIALEVGVEAYAELLAGAAAMDRHFLEQPIEQNLPIMLALLGVWYRNFLDRPTQVVAPYSHRLGRFVPWLQQLEMESNGKSTAKNGQAVAWATNPQLWGDVGTNGQHAFFQQLHQGSDWAPVDFILPIRSEPPHPQQALLVANCLAQSAALMQGRTAAEVRENLQTQGLSGEELEAAIPHRVFPGNRPSSMLTMPVLDPWHLGALLAAYEHKVFVQGVLWQVYSFDQWGVELGKKIATDVVDALADNAVGPMQGMDASTQALIEDCRAVLHAQ